MQTIVNNIVKIGSTFHDKGPNTTYMVSAIGNGQARFIVVSDEYRGCWSGAQSPMDTIPDTTTYPPIVGVTKDSVVDQLKHVNHQVASYSDVEEHFTINYR